MGDAEKISSVDVPVAQKLEQVAVHLVGPRFGDHVDHPTRMQTVACGKTAGLNAELLQRVGERERHVDVREVGDVVAAVQQVIGSVALPAGDRHGGRARIILAADHVRVRRRRGGAGDHDEVGDLAPVQRQLDDPALVDHLRDRVRPGLDHVGAGRDLHVFGDGAHLHDDIHLHATADLQHDTGLHMRLEAVRRHLQRVRADGQVRKAVGAVGS